MAIELKFSKYGWKHAIQYDEQHMDEALGTKKVELKWHYVGLSGWIYVCVIDI